MFFKGGACIEGKGHGHAMGAPRLSLRGTTEQIDAVGKEAWAPRHACWIWSDTSNTEAHARQRTRLCAALLVVSIPQLTSTVFC